MSLRNNDRQWGVLAKGFHWVMALGILGNGAFGLLMDLARSPMQKINWLAIHKSVGLTILGLFLLRLLWRMADRPPPDEPGPHWQRLAARLTHAMLYLLIAAMPLSGWWFNSVAGKPLQWFKQFNLPPLVSRNEELTHLAHGVHETLFWLLILVLVAHVGAALKHHLVDHDNVLRRMLPFVRPHNGSTSEGDHR